MLVNTVYIIFVCIDLYIRHKLSSLCAIFMQCVPYLISMSTDPDQSIKVKADQHLVDHTSRYGHLMQVSMYIL